jgi:hypothetical protein
MLGPRYFVFHGDGHCFALANLLSSLLARVAGTDAPVCYTVTPRRTFMHTFVEWNDGARRKILDADQKTIVDWDQAGPPYGMIYQLLSLGGALSFFGVDESDRRWLFAQSTHAAFDKDFQDATSGARIYHPSPTPEAIAGLFAEAKAQHVEHVSLDADDYPWKEPFRRASGGQRMLSQVERQIRLKLPPGAALTIGLNAEGLPELADVLPRVFFGRVPAILQTTVDASGCLQLDLPERPWMVTLSPLLERASVNGRSYPTHRCGRFAVLGAGDMDGLAGEPGIAGTFPFELQAPPGTSVQVVLPFNALALNSGAVQISGDGMASVWQRRAN